MDIVITYVNSLDPAWQTSYKRHTKRSIIDKRFRDWGTLKYLFRGIEANMPYIRKVHLVVSQESQVPEWVNRKTVNIVLHSDIIPAEHLPTFNCNPIEMHLHFIKGLDEQYLYFNDDMFPLMPCEATEFFRNGKAVIGISRHMIPWNMYKRICRNSDRIARKISGLKPSLLFLRPQHICSPMLKSTCKAVYKKAKKEILQSLTRTRESNNINQYLFLDYMYRNGQLINRRLSKKHFSLGTASVKEIHDFIKNPTHRFTCINDVCMSTERYNRLHSAIIEAFEIRFPNKSKYEL